MCVLCCLASFKNKSVFLKQANFRQLIRTKTHTLYKLHGHRFPLIKSRQKAATACFGWTLEEVFGTVSLESTEKYAWLKNPLPWCSILAEQSEITRLCHCVPVVLGFELGCSHLLWMQMRPMSHQSQKCQS